MVPQALLIKNLCVSTDKKNILHDVNLEIPVGKIHAIMGPNGSGKSSLALTIMGHPRYTITSGASGQMFCLGHDLIMLSPDKRAKLGIFLATQNPIEIEGISLRDFLRQAYNAIHRNTDQHLSPKGFSEHLQEQLDLLGIDAGYVERSVNVGFSGGEKKRAEMLQLAVLQPKIAILDEIDSGLDIDALKLVCLTLKSIKVNNPLITFVIITHNLRIFDFLVPDVVHIMQSGTIVQTGGQEVIKAIETTGFK